jgi:hypothetical protein
MSIVVQGLEVIKYCEVMDGNENTFYLTGEVA